MDSKEIRTQKLREVLLHAHLNPTTIDINEKIKIIEQVLEITANDPVQGSKEWAGERQIGGSDTSSVLGQGYYGRGLFDLVKEKIFGSSFDGNVATRFGRVMEEVTRKFIEKLFNTIVWEFKSLPNQLKYTSYSPDGVTVLKLFNKIMMLLLEFKTPMSRIPDGKIPKEYLPQIKAGMCAIPMVEGALFVNSMIRLCALADLKYNFDYNTRLHKSDTTTCKTRLVAHKSKLNQIIGMGLAVLLQNDTHRDNAAKLYNVDDNKSTTTSYGTTFVTFNTMPSLEDELLKKEKLTLEKTLANVARMSKTKQSLYTLFQKKHPNIMLPLEYPYVGILDNDTPNDIDKTFAEALLYDNENEYGIETESNTDTILNYVDKRETLDVFHIPPYIVTENLGRIDLLNKCGFQSAEINPELVSFNARVYFLEAMNYLRGELQAQNVSVVGVIPYKIFKMDLIFQPNNDPQYIKTLKPAIDKYAEIKSKCVEIDRSDASIEEKNKRKWDVIYEYFPDKKPENSNDPNDLLSKLDTEDTMF